jgi:hypothetical protein
MFLHSIHKVDWLSLKVKVCEMLSDFILLTLLFLCILCVFFLFIKILPVKKSELTTGGDPLR